MDNDKICEKSAKCPIYSGILESNPVLVQTYKNLYCHNGKIGRDKCKRFQVAIRIGSCPQDVLPNCQLTIDEIVKRMET